MNPDMDAIYFLSPLPHIVDCLLADFERRRYRRGFILWTGVLPDQQQRRLDGVRRQMAGMQGLLQHQTMWRRLSYKLCIKQDPQIFCLSTSIHASRVLSPFSTRPVF